MRADGTSLAHGIGGARDLPIPADLAILGAVVALVVSFAVLAVAWRSPRYAGRPDRGRPAPTWLARAVDAAPTRLGLRMVGLLLFGYAAVAAAFGPDLLTNPLFGMVFVLWWVGLVPASLLLGPVWKAISPFRTVNLALLTGGDPALGVLVYPARLGCWPAALGLYAFVWLELVYPNATELGPLRLWCAVYVAAMLLGGVLYGEEFYARADPFEVYSTLVARLSVWGRRDGELVVRSPLANLDATPAVPGLVAVVGVLFGSTGFDSFSASSAWVTFTQGAGRPTGLLDNLALLGFCAGATALFGAAAAATAVRPGLRHRDLPDLLAHSMVPIVVGYVAAHYLTYLVHTGQATLVQMSDPLGTGADLFGTRDLTVSYWLSYHPRLLAVVKVLAVVAGHVLAVVAAHDRCVALLPRRHRIVGQLPLLLAMVGFTVGGLYLLFAS